jgi:lycopene cyclase domain-containing protein
MYKYAFLNGAFILLAFFISWLTKPKHQPRRWLVTLLSLCLLTAVFDSIIISLGIVTYNDARLLGIYIGKAPVEDFGYTIASVIVAPSIWLLLKKHYVSKNS